MSTSFFLVLILGLAAYRITRFIVSDSLLDGIRNKLISILFAPDELTEPQLDEEGNYQPPVLDEPYRIDIPRFWAVTFGKLGELITCRFCIGFWVSLALYLSYQQWGLAWPIMAFAVAGVQALLGGWESPDRS